MSKFQEYLQKGIARFDYKNYIPETPSGDMFARQYNNVWGAITDTHCAKMDDGYIITGSIITNPYKFDQLLCSPFWGGMRFRDSRLGAETLSQYIYNAGFSGAYATVNGDNVYVLKPLANEDNPYNAQCCAEIGCAMCCTSESLVPLPYNRAVFEGCNTITDMVRALNENSAWGGKDWYVANLSKSTEVRCGRQRFIVMKQKNANA